MQLFGHGRILRTILASLILAGLSGLSAWAGELTYVVQRSDTLYGIARTHGISVAQLADRNGLNKNRHVKIGQRLVIPSSQPSGRAAPSTASVVTSLPPSISDAIRSAPVSKGRWKHIVIHHSGVGEGTVKGMDRYHREQRHMENGLAYHFVIGNGNGMRDGEIAVGQRWRLQLDGGHLRSESQNKTAIGICLVGDFDKAGPNDRQMKSLTALIKELMKRTNLPPSAVKTHRQINIIGTRCPGSKFPTKTFMAGLKK
jgi:LysM repeat protein